MRPFTFALTLGAVISGSGLTAHAADGDAPKPIVAPGLLTRAGLDEVGNMRLAIDAAALQSVRDGQGRVQANLPLTEDATVAVELERFEVVAPDAKFIQARGTEMALTDVPQVTLMRGQIVGEPASHVYLALNSRGGGLGSVQRGSGEQFHLRTHWVNDDPAGLLVQRGPGDLPNFDELCRVIPGPHSPSGAADGASVEARGPRVLNVAIEGDRSYCELFNDLTAAQEYVVQALGAVSDIYMRDLNMRLVVRSVRLWPLGGEPFSATDIFGFREYWLKNEDITGLNLVHLLSGRRDTDYGGIAFLTDACSGSGFGISAFLLGDFPSPVGQPHFGNWDIVVIAHEMGHNLGSPHTHSYDEPIDLCTSGVLQRGTIMSYCHTNMGGMLNIDLSMHTTVAALIADNNPPDSCLWHDCNGNAINDVDDIAEGRSADINFNGVPDECEDCNNNKFLDDFEIGLGAPDVNFNGILDSCESDCNGNSIPDAWELTLHLQQDLNGNGVPDSCEPDCDGNGVADFHDIFLGTHTDIDRNSVPDACQDCNNNGVVDWIDMDRQFNIYISQATNSVREYHRDSGVLIGDVGSGLVGEAYDIAFGPDRQLYVASFNLNQITRLNVDTGTATVFATQNVNAPSSLAFGPDGNLYVANRGNGAITKYDGETGAFIGTFTTIIAPGLWDIAFDANVDLIVLVGGLAAVKYNGTTGAFMATLIPALSGHLSDARGLAILPNGNLLITDRGNNVIHRFSASGDYLGQFNDVYPLPQPWSIAIAPNGNVFAAQTNESIRVIEYDAETGRYLRSYVRGDADLVAPTAIAFRPASPNDANGNGALDACETQPCVGDINGDHQVNVQDLLLVINNWGGDAGNSADVNNDGIVNVSDLLSVINRWGACEENGQSRW